VLRLSPGPRADAPRGSSENPRDRFPSPPTITTHGGRDGRDRPDSRSARGNVEDEAGTHGALRRKKKDDLCWIVDTQLWKLHTRWWDCAIDVLVQKATAQEVRT
jgi:hypothetical protein